MNDNLLQVINLEKSFISDHVKIDVLKGIDFNVKQGEMVALVGASGVGKSTLLHILGLLDYPTKGEIIFGDKNTTTLSSKERAYLRNKMIGFVFQFHHLLQEFTAIENVIMPALIARLSKNEALKKGIALLERIGLSHRINHKSSELSGGEQQRVALARALIMNPILLIADEPTGNLDSKSGEIIHQLFLDINKEFKTTIIIATHNEKLAGMIPKRIRLIDGKIA